MQRHSALERQQFHQVITKWEANANLVELGNGGYFKFNVIQLSNAFPSSNYGRVGW